MKSVTRPEFIYYVALRDIAHYESPAFLRRNAEKLYGLSYEEVLDMAYENIVHIARNAIKGKRAPKPTGGQ